MPALSNRPETCFNTQPPEGGWTLHPQAHCSDIRFNTQPPEGGWSPSRTWNALSACFNTQPPEGGWPTKDGRFAAARVFQHTAA